MLPRRLAALVALCLPFGLAGCSGSPGSDASEAAPQTRSATESSTFGEGDSATGDAETPEEAIAAEAAGIVADMSLEEKVAQLFLLTPEQLTGVGQVVASGDATREAYEKRPVAGVIYFTQNLLDIEQTRTMLQDMEDIAETATGLAPFLAIDEEGGEVSRVGGAPGFGIDNVGDMRKIGDAGDAAKAKEVAERIGDYLADLGFNVDFAPVADIANSSSTTMSRRAFGSTEAAVTPMVAAQIEGFADAGILSAAKHFPGIGGAHGDSHEDAIASAETLDEMRAEELKPFKAAIEAGVPFVMVGHLTVKEATGSDLPASLNPEIMQKVLREEMGYEGLIVTDSLSMGAVTKFYAPEEVGLQALLAGADMILMPLDFEASYQRLLKAVDDGEIAEERIDESVARIVRTKLAM